MKTPDDRGHLVDRIAKWIDAVIVPTLLCRWTGDAYDTMLGRHYVVGGEKYTPCGGLAIKRRHEGKDTILIGGGSSPAHLLEIILHECMHVHCQYLTQDEVDEINAWTGNVAWEGGYMDDPEERAARMFTAWGSTFLHGMPPRTVIYDRREPVLPVDLLFSEIFSGERAARLIAEGTVKLRHPSLAHPPAAPPRPPAPSLAFRAGAAAARAARRLLTG